MASRKEHPASPHQMSLFSEAHANPTASPASVSAWMIRAATWRSSPWELLTDLNPIGSSSRMCPVSCLPPKDETLGFSCERWMNSGILARGQAWTHNGSEWRSGASACSLSDILETGEIPQRYFLSPRACAGIVRRAARRGRPAPTIAARTKGGGGLGTDFDCDGGLIAGSLGTRSAAHPSGMKHEADFMVTHALGHQESPRTAPEGVTSIKLVPGAPRRRCNAHWRPDGARRGRHDWSRGNVPMACPAWPSPVALRGREGGGAAEMGGEQATALRASQGGGDKPHVLINAVRRLTPRECERLQGFPDDYTLITYRGKPAADGPRYKALGNSMAVPVMRWILRRIEISSLKQTDTP